MIELYQGDCLEVMKDIKSDSIDLVLADPPYGTTACKWDSIIPLTLLWVELRKIAKYKAAIVMTGSQPFTTILISSNMDMFRYEWIWKKSIASNFQQAKNSPLKRHENILVFSRGVVGHDAQTEKRMTYNPQGVSKVNHFQKRNPSRDDHKMQRKNGVLKGYNQTQGGYPDSLLIFNNGNNDNVHPTQKPVPLMEYLIKTYSDEGQTVLDFCMGSGTTGIAAKKTGRSFIGIEKDPEYFKIAEQRIKTAEHQLSF